MPLVSPTRFASVTDAYDSAFATQGAILTWLSAIPTPRGPEWRINGDTGRTALKNTVASTQLRDGLGYDAASLSSWTAVMNGTPDRDDAEDLSSSLLAT